MAQKIRITPDKALKLTVCIEGDSLRNDVHLPAVMLNIIVNIISLTASQLGPDSRLTKYAR
jgi:hypothetical protein